jgi:hypothetical protein
MFGRLALDAKAIIAEATKQGMVVRGAMGEGEPEFTEAYFRLNGDRSQDLDYETFAWEAMPTQQAWEEGNEIFDFCKTARRPYDAVVTAILIRAKLIYGDCVDVRSDGEWHEWQAGRELYEATFSEQAPNPFATVMK